MAGTGEERSFQVQRVHRITPLVQSRFDCGQSDVEATLRYGAVRSPHRLAVDRLAC
jgi:hypothetical protein